MYFTCHSNIIYLFIISQLHIHAIFSLLVAAISMSYKKLKFLELIPTLGQEYHLERRSNQSSVLIYMLC
jgi:hypothetical protein